jgi:hypothetical protein
MSRLTDAKVPILYIGGYSRSGSTILMRLLGKVEGLFPIGELWDVWARSFTQNQLCGCGKPFRDCEFWTEVVRDAFGGFDKVDVDHMQSLRHRVQGNQVLLPLMVPALRSNAYRIALQEYSLVLDQFYRSIQKVSGCRMIVDSSKVPPYAFLLKELPSVALSILHLVRDSRATAYSWQRKKQRPEIHWKTEYMEQYSPVRSAFEWNVMNGMFQFLQGTGAPYQRIRYEEMVAHPAETLNAICQRLGIDGTTLDFGADGQTVQVATDHTVSGNPNRFQQGAVKIRPDHEWQTKMSPTQKYLVTALTFPQWLWYGYGKKDTQNKFVEPFKNIEV